MSDPPWSASTQRISAVERQQSYEIGVQNRRLLGTLLKIKERKPVLGEGESVVTRGSAGINARREERRVHEENIKLVDRLEKVEKRVFLN